MGAIQICPSMAEFNSLASRVGAVEAYTNVGITLDSRLSTAGSGDMHLHTWGKIACFSLNVSVASAIPADGGTFTALAWGLPAAKYEHIFFARASSVNTIIYRLKVTTAGRLCMHWTSDIPVGRLEFSVTYPKA